MSAIEKLHSEVVDLSGGELKRAAERVIEAVAQLDASSAEDFVALTRDLWGGVAICELNGLRLLLEETLAAVEDAQAGAVSWDDLRRVLGEALVVIPRLLDYLVRSRRDNPCLLIPEITALRTLRRKPPVYEYQVLFGIDWPKFHIGPANLSTVVAADDLKRILHLYQLGLVSVLKGVNRAKGYEILMRSVARLEQLADAESERNYWPHCSWCSATLRMEPCCSDRIVPACSLPWKSSCVRLPASAPVPPETPTRKDFGVLS